MKKNLTVVIFTLFVVIIIGLIGFAIKQTAEDSKALEPFAQCIQESGATFYGAFWCPHCNSQKALFGRSNKFLPYTECSTPDGNAQTDICIEQEIESYPTWEFADGSRLGGVLSLAILAEKTGCELPGESSGNGEEEIESPESEVDDVSVGQGDDSVTEEEIPEEVIE